MSNSSMLDELINNLDLIRRAKKEVDLQKTHNVFVNHTYRPGVPFAFSYIVSDNKFGDPRCGGTMEFPILANRGNWIADQFLHIRFESIKPIDNRDKIRYCDFLGHRLIEKVELVINDKVVSSYDNDLYNAYFHKYLKQDKRPAWLRNIGQEKINIGYLTSDPSQVNNREYRLFGDGAQTTKSVQDTIDIRIPLLFWYNTELKNMFPIGRCSLAKIYIRVKFAEQSKLIAGFDFGGGGKIPKLHMSTCDLYSNTMDTLPEVTKLLMQNLDVIAMRTFITARSTLTSPKDSVKMKDIKYPTEHLLIGFRPIANDVFFDAWYRNSELYQQEIEQPVSVGGVISYNNALYFKLSNTISEMRLNVLGNEIYKYQSPEFYTNYLTFSAEGVNSSEDDDWHMMNFTSGTAMSGHINFSASREINLDYTSNTISPTNQVYLILIAKTINFLFFADDFETVSLKYI